MKRRIVCLVLLLALVLTTCTACVTNGANEAKNSVVRIVSYWGGLADESGTVIIPDAGASGSGFAVGKKGEPVRYFVTNRHMVERTFEDEYGNVLLAQNADDIYVVFGDFQDARLATIVYLSDRTDLAILSLGSTTTERVPAVLKPFDTLDEQVVTSIGFPGGADYIVDDAIALRSSTDRMTTNEGKTNTVLTHGETHRGELIQHNAAISGGNSGGPLVDTKGRVLGVNTWGINDTTIFYSISSNEVIRMLDQERIPYIAYGGFMDDVLDFLSNPAVIIVLVVAVVAVAAIIFLLLSKRSKYVLIVEAGALAGKQYKLAKGKDVKIGRHKGKCQIVYPDKTPNVSAIHCTVKVTANGVTITDENSTCGTFVGGEKIPAGRPVRLQSGQKVCLGSNAQVFTIRG